MFTYCSLSGRLPTCISKFRDSERRIGVCPPNADLRKGRERRSGGDRRSGKERRKAKEPQYRGVERRGSKKAAAGPKCQRCIATFGEMKVLILECPSPDRDCTYKQHHEMIHYVTYPSARTENDSAVVASSSHNIFSPSVILIRPDPILANHQIYYVDVMDGQTT